MARVNAQQYAEKWSRRLKGSTEDIRAGVERVQEAPGAKAAKQKELMKTKLVEAIDSGRWERNVAAVPLEEWKSKIINKGLNRISAGVDGAQDKQIVMAEKLLRNIDEVQAIVNRTPRGSLEDNITRMTTHAREMAKRKIK